MGFNDTVWSLHFQDIIPSLLHDKMNPTHEVFGGSGRMCEGFSWLFSSSFLYIFYINIQNEISPNVYITSSYSQSNNLPHAT